MRWNSEIWHLTRSESLSHFFLNRTDLEEWVKVCTDSYLICSQLHAGDLNSKHLEQITFEQIYEHIYTAQGGCPWCRNRVDLKMNKWLSCKEYQERTQESQRPAGINVLPVSLS